MLSERGKGIGALQEFSLVQVVSVIFIAANAAVIFPVQPVLLNSLLHGGRITAVQVGQAATAELIGMAIMSFVASAMFRVSQMKWIVLATIGCSCLANLLTMASSGGGVIVARFLCGASSGVLLWLFISTLVRSTSPTRLNGIYVASLSVLGLCLAALCEHWFIPEFGARGPVICLLCLNLLMVVPGCLIPKQLVALPKRPRSGGLPEPGALLALVSIAAFFGALTSFWVYVIPILVQLGLSNTTIDLAIEVTIASQIIGGVVAAGLGERLSYFIVMGGCTVVGLLVEASVHASLSPAFYVIALGVFGFAWMLAPPYQVLFAIAAGPSRRAAVFLVTAQVVGAGLGPFISSLVVANHAVEDATYVSGCLFLLSLVLLLLVHGVFVRRPRTAALDLA